MIETDIGYTLIVFALFAFVVLWNSAQIARRIWELGRGGGRAS